MGSRGNCISEPDEPVDTKVTIKLIDNKSLLFNQKDANSNTFLKPFVEDIYKDR